jgi:hypothetical protein
MAKDKQSFEDLSEPAEQAGEENMEKARGARDNYFGFLQNTMLFYPWGSQEITEKSENLYQAKHLRVRRVRKQTEPGQGFPRGFSNSD